MWPYSHVLEESISNRKPRIYPGKTREHFLPVVPRKSIHLLLDGLRIYRPTRSNKAGRPIIRGRNRRGYSTRRIKSQFCRSSCGKKCNRSPICGFDKRGNNFLTRNSIGLEYIYYFISGIMYNSRLKLYIIMRWWPWWIIIIELREKRSRRLCSKIFNNLPKKN